MTKTTTLAALAAALALAGCDTTGHLGQGSGVSYERPAFGFGNSSGATIDRRYVLGARALAGYCRAIGATLIHDGRGCARFYPAVADATMPDAAGRQYWGAPSLCVIALQRGTAEAQALELQQARATCQGWGDSRDFWARARL